MKHKVAAQELFSPAQRKFEWKVTGGLVTFCVLGYLLYFAARWGEPPMWVLTGIETLKPILGALSTAARVSDAPFPAQVMIVYCALGFPLLTAWATYWALLVRESRKVILHRTEERPRWKLACLGSGQLVLVLSFIGICVHEHTGTIGWEMHAFFSSGFGSATMLLVGYGGFAIGLPVALYWLWIGLTGYPGKHVASRDRMGGA